MAVPSTPTNLLVQNGNANVFLSWDLTATATSYKVQRSTDGITYSVVGSPAPNNYLDTTVTVGTLYYYQVAAHNVDGDSSYTSAQTIVPTNAWDVSLGQVRLMAQQRADMVNSSFVSTTEWNSYINNSYAELYDLLINVYDDWFLAAPYIFTTTGVQQYTLPADFYRSRGVDAGVSNNSNAFVRIQTYEFIDRNQYIFSQPTTNLSGTQDLRYRFMGNTIFFNYSPASGQYIKIWYIPKLVQLLQDTDILVGVSGWAEYVIVDAAIKAMQKEESDVSVLAAQKMALMKRIEASAISRDAGETQCISDSMARSSSINGYGPWNWGGF